MFTIVNSPVRLKEGVQYGWFLRACQTGLSAFEDRPVNQASVDISERPICGFITNKKHRVLCFIVGAGIVMLLLCHFAPCIHTPSFDSVFRV